MASDKPQYLSVDPAQIVQDMIAFFQAQFLALTGIPCVLQPAQIERLIINMFAYRESLFRNQVNEAAAQNLPQFSTAPILDYIAAVFGVFRIPAQSSVCQIEFTLVGGHGSGTIPAGMRIASTDGAYVYTTDIQTAFSSLDTTITVNCTSQQNGLAGNGYLAGTISVIVDPQAAVASATNLATTTGGTDDESDEQMRVRLLLASTAFSTAGSTEAYKFHARSADATIVDVAVISPVAGQVAIYPLVVGGIVTPPNVLAAVLAACNPENVRPLTDTVNVFSPTKLDYRITINAIYYSSADATATTQEINAKLAAYSELSIGTLGHDIQALKIGGLANAPDGVYTATVVLEQKVIIFGTPYWFTVSQIIVSDTQFAANNTTTVNVTGTVNG